MVWRGDVVARVVMLTIGFFVNTLFISTYLRPKIAAEKSEVLNFYWMFIALVTGVYTFGLMGIIIGPVLISVLKAIFDAISGEPGQASVVTLTAEPGEKTRASSG
jgi:predicted PurR-regulated permease PerM